MLNWNLHSFQLFEIIQVLDSISWVRCASGNVLSCVGRKLFPALVFSCISDTIIISQNTNFDQIISIDTSSMR